MFDSPNASLLLITTVALVAIVFLLAIIISLLFYMRKQRIGFSQTKVTLPLEICETGIEQENKTLLFCLTLNILDYFYDMWL
jgi:hypothetical protein